MRRVFEKGFLLIWMFFARVIPDKLFLRVQFRLVMGYWMDFQNPKTYNEKLQWLKLYDRNPSYSRMVDKYEAKEYVSGIIGPDHIIPTIGVWDSVDEIDFSQMPSSFVLKCTHDSGGIVICKDKSQFDIDSAKRKLRKAIKINYYYQNREWPYLNVKPRIIAEQLMVDESGFELKDYKWFCFHGEPKALFIASDRMTPGEETKFDFFDMEYNHLPFTNGHPNAKELPQKPQSFEEMKDLSRKLSKGIPHVRVDFYDINGHVYFGELTFYHWSGIVPFNPPKWDKTFGDWLHLDLLKSNA